MPSAMLDMTGTASCVAAKRPPSMSAFDPKRTLELPRPLEVGKSTRAVAHRSGVLLCSRRVS